MKEYAPGKLKINQNNQDITKSLLTFSCHCNNDIGNCDGNVSHVALQDDATTKYLISKERVRCFCPDSDSLHD